MDSVFEIVGKCVVLFVWNWFRWTKKCSLISSTLSFHQKCYYKSSLPKFSIIFPFFLSKGLT